MKIALVTRNYNRIFFNFQLAPRLLIGYDQRTLKENSCWIVTFRSVSRGHRAYLNAKLPDLSRMTLGSYLMRPYIS